MAEKFSGCEIVELAVQIEQNGKEFYSELIKKTDNSKIAEILGYLAEEENNHIDTMKEISGSMCDYNPPEAYPDEYFAYMKALASQYIFTQKDKGSDIAYNIRGYQEGIDMGIQFEKDSILFYEEMKKLVPEKGKELVGKVILEEKGHLTKLCDLRGGCEDE
ncbi:MAG: ferritin family protein [Candidatus Omnitrophota bacterium]